MGLLHRLGKYSLGAFAGLSVVGLLGACAYTAMYIQVNCPWQSYQYGRLAEVAGLAYAICVISIIALCIYGVALVFIVCNCCNCFKNVLIAIGTIIWLVCFFCECFFVAWTNSSLPTKIIEESESSKFREYAKAFTEKHQEAYYADGSSSPSPVFTLQPNGFDQGQPPTFGWGMSVQQGTGRQEMINLPVCYFNNAEDKKNFKPAACSGNWDGEKLKNYFDEQAKQQADLQKWTKDGNNNALFLYALNHGIMYTTSSPHGIFPIMLGVQIAAIVFGILYVFFAMTECCCGCCPCCKSNQVAPEP